MIIHRDGFHGTINKVSKYVLFQAMCVFILVRDGPQPMDLLISALFACFIVDDYGKYTKLENGVLLTRQSFLSRTSLRSTYYHKQCIRAVD
jgi:hypothetical protein